MGARSTAWRPTVSRGGDFVLPVPVERLLLQMCDARLGQWRLPIAHSRARGRGRRVVLCLRERDRGGHMMTGIRMHIVAALAAGVCLAAPAAQAPDKEDRAAAIKQALAANRASLRQYTWIETTEISLKGEEKKKEQ